MLLKNESMRFSIKNFYTLVNAVLLLLVYKPSRANEPSLNDVIHAALKNAKLQRSDQEDLSRRLRLSALLPRMITRLIQNNYFYETLNQQADRPDRYDTNARVGTLWEVRGIWDLSALIYSVDEVRNRALDHTHQKARLELIEQVAKLYAERQILRDNFLRTKLGHQENSNLSHLKENLIRTTVLLDAFTDGLYRNEFRYEPETISP